MEEAMRIAYLTTDEVNENLAAEMAACCGATLHPFSPAEALPKGKYDAILCDWDYLPRAGRRKMLRRLVRNHIVALHGYNLNSFQIRTLRHFRVAVYRRLRSSIFAQLTRRADRGEAHQSPELEN
jgi:hypothetical protein